MTGWHVLREDDAVTVARSASPRWDVAVDATLPSVVSPARLAHQIRQDMWRRLQRVRGFRPAVRVACTSGACAVRAGGEVAGVFPRAQTEDVIADLLASPAHRARWVAHAGGRCDA